VLVQLCLLLEEFQNDRLVLHGCLRVVLEVLFLVAQSVGLGREIAKVVANREASGAYSAATREAQFPASGSLIARQLAACLPLMAHLSFSRKMDYWRELGAVLI
jgi:hypothetical protein